VSLRFDETLYGNIFPTPMFYFLSFISLQPYGSRVSEITRDVT